MKRTSLCTFFSVALLSVALAQKEKNTPAEQEAIVAIDRAFETAYGSANYKALAGFFTEDAEYTSDEGRTISGRAAIEQAFKDALSERKGGTIAIEADSVKVLAPGVVVEKGSTLVTAKSGETDNSQYTAIYVKDEGGKWKISQLIESPAAAEPHDRLTELGWLIGKWKESDKESNLDISSEYVWARGGNFITRNVSVKSGKDVTLEGWQIIGYDPVEERLRAWTFDSEGGFSTGLFTREGNRWLLREAGFTADGNRTGADNTITKTGDDKFTWESGNRTLNGEPQPGIGKIEIVRAKGE